MAEQDALYPLKLVTSAVPLSLQASAKSKDRPKQTVREAARERGRLTADFVLLDRRPLALNIYCLPPLPMRGHIDNIVKPIMDALIGIAYLDDRVVERVLVQKFEPQVDWAISTTSEQLAAALEGAHPCVYICVSDDLSWRTVP